MQLGPKLELILADKGWIASELSRRSGVSKSKISRIINDGRKATPAELVKLHRATGVPLIWLMDDSLDEMPSKERTDAERRLLDFASTVGFEVSLDLIKHGVETIRLKSAGSTVPTTTLSDSANPPRESDDPHRRHSGT